MEFTKLSPDPAAEAIQDEVPERAGRVFPLPQHKTGALTVTDYLRKAAPDRAIRSSIPQAIQESAASARAAEDSARTE